MTKHFGRNPFVNQVSSFKPGPKKAPKVARRNPFVNQVSSFPIFIRTEDGLGSLEVVIPS
jgi:hypothetical protein